jgi:hypothetical protein
MFYWPVGFWHVGESPQISMSLNITIYMDGQPLDMCTQLLTRMAEMRSQNHKINSYPFPLQPHQTKVKSLPDTLLTAAHTVVASCQTSALQAALKEEWLKKITSFGLTPYIARRATLSLLDDSYIEVNDVCPIVWTYKNSEEIIYAANGHTSTTAAQSSVIDMLENLNKTEVINVGRLLDQYSYQVDMRNILRSILEDLYSMYGVGVKLLSPIEAT